MTRIPDAFDDLIAQHPEGDPDAILATARQAAETDRSRRRTVLGLATAAAIVVVAAAVAVAVTRSDEPGDQIHAGPDPTASTTVTAAPAATVQVFFGRGTADACLRTEAVERPRSTDEPGDGGRLADAIGQLLDGPTEAEAGQGLTSLFASASGTLRSADISGTTATIDFDPSITEMIDGASTSCGSASILAQLSTTARQFARIDDTVFTIGGDPEAFDAWLGIDPLPDPPPDATTTTTTPAATPSGAGYAIASSEGVSLRTGTDPSTDVKISDAPAAAAFAIGTDLVAYQGAATDADRTPPWPDGGVRLWTREKSISLPLDERTTRAVLLDAGTVDGSPKALVAQHRGTNPDTAHEALVLIDLRTLQSETIVDNPSWESGHVQARLLPDGDVIGLMTSSVSWSLVRWTAGSAEPVWTTPAAQDTTQSLAIRGYRAALVEVWHDPGGVKTRPIDLDTGALGAPTTIRPSLPDTTVWCGDWYRLDELSCARGGWPAGGLGSDGAWRELSTPDGAIVTASRD